MTEPRQHEIVLRFLAEPIDVNFGGKVHGGSVMKWIDQAAYACAAGWCGQYCVTAYVGGMARRFDIQLDQAGARRIADLPTTSEGITSGLRNIAAQADIFTEGIGETTDLTAGDQGIAAQFEGDAAANRQIERRVLERQASNRAGTGGAVIGSGGVVGAGST